MYLRLKLPAIVSCFEGVRSIKTFESTHYANDIANKHFPASFICKTCNNFMPNIKLILFNMWLMA